VRVRVICVCRAGLTSEEDMVLGPPCHLAPSRFSRGILHARQVASWDSYCTTCLLTYLLWCVCCFSFAVVQSPGQASGDLALPVAAATPNGLLVCSGVAAMICGTMYDFYSCVLQTKPGRRGTGTKSAPFHRGVHSATAFHATKVRTHCATAVAFV
jgi:hypothetical protein